MSRVIAVTACGLMLGACSAAMPSLDFLKSAPQSETLAIESEPAGAEAKTSLGQSCRTPCQLAVQPGSEFSVTLALSGYHPQTVAVRPDAEGSTPRLAPNPVQVTLQAVKPATKPPAKKKSLGYGSVVQHPKYGRGTVLRREGDGDDAKLTISFPGYGLKKIVEKYAGIKTDE